MKDSSLIVTLEGTIHIGQQREKRGWQTGERRRGFTHADGDWLEENLRVFFVPSRHGASTP